ncbi:MAG: homocysteine S-methyltransferase [archaeon]|nr:homocysteine S-methyltransferase [archaeon]
MDRVLLLTPAVLEEECREHGVLVLDGGLATELERRGFDLNDRLWSARLLLEDSGREAIVAVHKTFLEAGARVVTTASYQASVEGYGQRGLSEEEAVELVRESVRLARRAASGFEGRRFVAGSVGPYGACLANGAEYRGDYGLSREEYRRFHEPRLRALLEAGCDVVTFETIPKLCEALALLELLSELSDRHFCWLSFSCRGDGALSIADGTPLAVCLPAVSDHPRVLAVGFNCLPPSLIPPLLTAARPLADKPFVVYPNSGETFDPSTKQWSSASSSAESKLFSFSEQAHAWHLLGAHIIGGCCRTTPAVIAALSASFSQSPKMIDPWISDLITFAGQLHVDKPQS